MSKIKSPDIHIVAKGGRTKATIIKDRAYSEVEQRLINAVNSEMDKILAAGIDPTQIKVDMIMNADEYIYIEEMKRKLNSE